MASETIGPQALRAWRAFLEAHARVTARLEHELLDAHGIPLSWYDVLVQLSEAPQVRLRMRELADAVLLSRSGLTRLVDRMDAAGLVERCADPADRRGVYVALSPGGLQLLREAAPTHLAGVERYFAASITEGESATVAGVLDRVARE